jgi:hypothetical protein
MTTAAPFDQAPFELVPALHRADFVGAVTFSSRPNGARATVVEVYKGSLDKGQTLDGVLAREEYSRPSMPAGTVVVVAEAGVFTPLRSKTLIAWLRPSLALLQGSTDLTGFELERLSKDTMREFFAQVLGFEVVPVEARERAVRALLARSTPEWEGEWMVLPQPLRLPSLAPDFVEYFGRFPSDRFNSAARWVVFSELEAAAAVPYLRAEIERLRVANDSNSLWYALDAIVVSAPREARCVFEQLRAEGVWLAESARRRDADDDLARRLATLPPARCSIEFRPGLTVPGPQARDAQLLALRRLGLFSAELPRAFDAMTFAEKSEDPELATVALLAAGAIAARSTGATAAHLEPLAVRLAKQYSVRRAPSLHAASDSLARLIDLAPELFDWLLAHPTPMLSSGRADDLLRAVLQSLDLRDQARAEAILRASTKAGKGAEAAVWVSRAHPALLQRTVKAELDASATPTAIITSLQLSGRAGLGSLPLERVAGFLQHREATVRAAALDTFHMHLVGSEAYSQGVPYFPRFLDALEDEAPAVREQAVRLVSQLAVKGLYPQYRSPTPALAQLAGQVVDRTEAATAEKKRRLLEALANMGPDAFTGTLAARRTRLLSLRAAP